MIRVPFDALVGGDGGEARTRALEGFFVHPVLDERVMAGNGVIGLELVEQLDGIDAVLIPWGGGGLTTGIASALAQLSPATRVSPASRRPGRR